MNTTAVTGVLAGMKCPKCQANESFTINADAVIVVADHVVIDVDDFTWTEHSGCTCRACGHAANVSDFCVTEPMTPLVVA